MDVDDFEERVDEFRQKHESRTEWNLRKTFMMTHKDKYPLNRLLCFAACFINYECYGCTYPGPVMVELKELMEEITDVLEEHRSSITQAREIQFVKDSGENLDSFPSSIEANTSVPQQRKRPIAITEQKLETPSAGKIQKMSFVKASDSSTSTDIGEKNGSEGTSVVEKNDSKSTSGEWMPVLSLGGGTGGCGKSPTGDENTGELLDKFYTLKANIKDSLRKAHDHPVSALHMAADKAKLTITANLSESNTHKGKFTCLLQMDFVDISTATAQNKKNAKNNAYEAAISEFKKTYFKINKSADGRLLLEASQAPVSSEGLQFPTPSAKTRQLESGLTGLTKSGKSASNNVNAFAKNTGSKWLPPSTNNQSLEEFLILTHHTSGAIPGAFVDTNILRNSADFNRMSLEYDFRHDSMMETNRTRCLVSLQGIIMADVEGESRQDAKHLASVECMNRLRQMCWSIQIKQAADSSDLGLSREEVLGDIAAKSEAIPESNVGSKLLKAMGWKGGGIGKKGTGIAEPINVESVINREGLGLKSEQGITKDFQSSMRAVVQAYAQSNKQSDLVFSPDFSKDERASIHKICQQLGLKTRSHGVGDKRHLVAARRRTPNQLFEHIMKSGGETSKYVLIPPGGVGEEAYM